MATQKTMEEILSISDARNRVIPLIRFLAEDSSNVYFSDHAMTRMEERGITTLDVISCLRNGLVTERPHTDVHGNWRCTLQHNISGDRVNVVAAIDEDKLIIIVVTSF